jgi:hypothetical protein
MGSPEVHTEFLERPKGNRQLGRPQRIQEDKIKIDFQDVGWGMDWTDLAQNRHK